MTYTPINWQTGDTITAEKMNKMDNGWAVESTQLFSETVTTAEEEGIGVGQITYANIIDTDTIAVTFNGTDYTCPRVEAYGQYFYGGFSSEGPDFTVFPFAIDTSQSGNYLLTETPGTYTVTVATQGAVVSDDFNAAVAIASPTELFVATANATTWQDVHDAVAAKKLAFVYEESGSDLYCYPVLSVTSGSGYEVATAMEDGGGVATRYYQAATADGPIYSN